MGKLKELFYKWKMGVPAGHEYYAGGYHRGYARLVFIPSGENRIFDGPFQFRHHLHTGAMEKCNGKFSKNWKDGVWHFEHISVHGSKRLLDVNFADGVIDGELDFTRRRLNLTEDTVSQILAFVDHGVVKGPITGKINDGSFKGSCDNDGQPDGLWQLTYQDEVEDEETVQTEVWEHGELKDSYEEVITHKTVKTQKSVGLLNHVKYLIDEDCSSLLMMVKRGTKTVRIVIGEPNK